MDVTGSFDWHPTAAEVAQAFATIVASLGGTLVDVVEAGGALYARAVLPHPAEVRRGDAVLGGVAVRVVHGEIFVHPYVLRQVCGTGAVRTHAVGTRVLERVDAPARAAAAQRPAMATVLQAFDEAVRAAADPARMADAVREMQSALDIRAAAAIDRLQLRSLLLALPERALAGDLRQAMWPILSQALTTGWDGDRSAFAFANAVTATARDVADPALRWAMEEYGAAIVGATILEQSPPRAHRWRETSRQDRSDDR